MTVFEKDFHDFENAWKDFTDRYQCIKMKTKHMPEFFMKLPLDMQGKIGFKEKSKQEEQARVILKMGINVDDGFVYFNEMLYRIMRAQYVTAKSMKLNKVLAVTEIVTQFKLAEITQKSKNLSNKLNKDELEKAFFTTLEA